MAAPEPPQALPRPVYRVETERLLIRCWEPADGPRLRAALDELDSYLRPWIPWMRHEPQSLDETVARLRGYRASFDLDRDYRYGVFDPTGTELIGETGLYPRVGPGAREIGYWTHSRHAGRGYATEAAAAMVRIAFEIDRVERIEIHCAVGNAPSAVVPRKLGFAHEATLRRRTIDSE
ncbi:MAG TPA: GNAT family N-acetyltransferase, partial [Steroidobacteraceae bacterium]|nr:GNAT family N-acetyltransferase [Steroidobacteraceae bacterium]